MTVFLSLESGQLVFIVMSMLLIFLMGFFLDFIEISFIVIPILVPICHLLNIDPLWFGLMVAINLQTSFLTPPFGFSIFYLKAVAPKEIETTEIYKGVLPYWNTISGSAAACPLPTISNVASKASFLKTNQVCFSFQLLYNWFGIRKIPCHK